jgi:hypothetical protein
MILIEECLGHFGVYGELDRDVLLAQVGRCVHDRNLLNDMVAAAAQHEPRQPSMSSALVRVMQSGISHLERGTLLWNGRVRPSAPRGALTP